MVSTRQMATSSSSNCGSSGNSTNSSHSFHSNAVESARLSVVTRQTSSQYVLLNCSTMPLNPQQQQQQQPHRNLVNGGAAAASTSRQTHLTQALKVSGGAIAGNCNGNNNNSNSIVVVGNNQNHNNNNNNNGNNNFNNDIVEGYAAEAEGDIENTNINTQQQRQLHLFDLPLEILTHILTFVGYKKIGQSRVVSRQFNDVCMHILNSTFSKLITQTYNRVQAIKANMPRRESARRKHPLACESDIIETCHMRLSLLQMSFGKHIERGYCCFFPGAILDEVYTILNYIKNTPRLERPYKVTDELFDLSTMAMEYFRERIEPTLPDIAYYNKDFFKTKRTTLVTTVSDMVDNTSSLPSPPQSNMVLRKGIRKIKQGMKIYNNQLTALRTELRTCKRKSSEQGKQIAEQQKLLADQQKQTLEYANRLDENDKKNEEIARKFSTLLQELNKCKTELQYWRSKSPAMPTCTSCGQKCAPMLPPEDYQALINQGVKLDELNDDTDAESDVSMGENQLLSLSNEFAFPDENTTAKLLAVNTATKNLKRQYHHSNSTITSHNTMNSSLNEAANNKYCSHFEASQPSQMTSSLECARGNAEGNHSIIKTITCSPGQQQQHKDLTAEASSSFANTLGGYSTKLFYGNNNRGVIVSPAMMWAKQNAASSEDALQCGSSGNINNNIETIETAATALPLITAAEDVVTLASLASHETKKARRVQKANTRGVQCTSTAGKRSK